MLNVLDDNAVVGKVVASVLMFYCSLFSVGFLATTGVRPRSVINMLGHGPPPPRAFGAVLPVPVFSSWVFK